MSYQKERITEESAAAKFVAKTIECVEYSWLTIYQGMKGIFGDCFVIKNQTQAVYDLTLATIAVGMQAIRNLNQTQQAERIQTWILRCFNTREYSDYAISEIKEYDQAFQKGIENISQGEDPIMAVSARLLHRWLGSDLHKFEIVVPDKKTGVFSPFLVMMTADVLMQYAGVWKVLCDAFEVSGSDLPHDLSADYDWEALGLRNYRPELEKQKPDGTIRYLDEHGNRQEKWLPPELLDPLLRNSGAKRLFTVLIKGPWQGVKAAYWELSEMTQTKFVDQNGIAYALCCFVKGKLQYNLIMKKLWDIEDQVGKIFVNPGLSEEEKLQAIRSLTEE